MGVLLRRIVDKAYYLSALVMPMWWRWQWLFIMQARFYFEVHAPGHRCGWPWAWCPYDGWPAAWRRDVQSGGADA